MGEFEDKLNEILGSPESMEQIMRLAKTLGGGEEKAKGAEKAPAGGLDPALLSLFASVMGEMERADDKSALMNAMKPYLKAERREKVDRALQIAKLARAARTVLPELGGKGRNV